MLYRDLILAHVRVEEDVWCNAELFGDAKEWVRRLLCTACGQVQPHGFFADSRFPSLYGMIEDTWFMYRLVRGPRVCVQCDYQDSTRKHHCLIRGELRFVCESCHCPNLFCERVYLRKPGDNMHQSLCTGCADEQNVPYTVRSDNEGFVVYDTMIDLDQIVEDLISGRIPSRKFRQFRQSISEQGPDRT